VPGIFDTGNTLSEQDYRIAVPDIFDMGHALSGQDYRIAVTGIFDTGSALSGLSNCAWHFGMGSALPDRSLRSVSPPDKAPGQRISVVARRRRCRATMELHKAAQLLILARTFFFWRTTAHTRRSFHAT
jgi:hypothetical protein